MDMNLVKLAVDSYKGCATGNFSKAENMETIKNALIELNGGSTKLTRKSLKNPALFELIETVLTELRVEGLPENSPIYDFVEFKETDAGNKESFFVPDNSFIAIADAAAGTLGIRRQKVGAGKEVAVNTTFKVAKIYAELELVLAGRIDWVEFIERAKASLQKKNDEDILTAFAGTYSKVVAPYLVTGTFDADNLLEIVDHVEAATGMSAKIIGTRTAVRKIGLTGTSDLAKNDIYNMGYEGKFNGVPVFALKNGHKAGSTDFILNDTDLYVVAGDDKFIKFVTEGDVILEANGTLDNADMSQEFALIQKTGVAVVLSQAFGVYRISAN